MVQNSFSFSYKVLDNDGRDDSSREEWGGGKIYSRNAIDTTSVSYSIHVSFVTMNSNACEALLNDMDRLCQVSTENLAKTPS